MKVTVDDDSEETTLGVYLDNGEELDRYCVVEDPELERDGLERMITKCVDERVGPARYLLSEIHGALTVIASGSHDSWVRESVEKLLTKILDSARMAERLDLDQLEALLAEATPGPWRDMQDGSPPGMGGPRPCVLGVRDGRLIDVAMMMSFRKQQEDAALIAALRNAAPSLIKRLRDLEQASHYFDGLWKTQIDALMVPDEQLHESALELKRQMVDGVQAYELDQVPQAVPNEIVVRYTVDEARATRGETVAKRDELIHSANKKVLAALIGSSWILRRGALDEEVISRAVDPDGDVETPLAPAATDARRAADLLDRALKVIDHVPTGAKCSSGDEFWCSIHCPLDQGPSIDEPRRNCGRAAAQCGKRAVCSEHC